MAKVELRGSFKRGVTVREGPAAKNAARRTINNLRRCDPLSLPHEVIENAQRKAFQTPSYLCAVPGGLMAKVELRVGNVRLQNLCNTTQPRDVNYEKVSL